MFKRCCYILFVFEILLGVAHLLWPEYRWGQGRRSYFNLDNSLTLASWLASMQFVGISVLALIGFHRERQQQNTEIPQTAWIWLLGALMALALSMAEMTRIHLRLKLLSYPTSNVYEQFVIFPLWLILLFLFSWFLLDKLQRVPGSYKYGVGWLMMWGLNLHLAILSSSTPLASESWYTGFTLVRGLTYLFGGTLLLMALGGYVLNAKIETAATATPSQKDLVPFPEGASRIGILLGVGGMTFIMVFLQIVLFQMLNIFADYLSANSVISIALLGISVGGLVGFYTARQAPLEAMTGASLLFPPAILLAFGTVVIHMDRPLLASMLLMLPFILGSIVISIALVWIEPHLVYCIDLLGAGLGVLLVSPALSHFREESSLLFLIAFTFLAACCFIVSYPVHRVRIWLILLMLTGSLGFLIIGCMNLQFDWLNIVKTKIIKQYPQAEVLFSRSSLVGRFDVVRRKPGSQVLKTYENGRTVDTIRRNPTADYRIDPRVPHTLMKDPVILILGLSGDGITKTAKSLGQKVYGVEINPAIVGLQTSELVEFNAGSYENIEVSVTDARSFLQQNHQRYDIITLMNAHFARGRAAGRMPSPEYLHTLEAVESYLNHLTDRGILIVEEPVSQPIGEPPVWKLLITMRQALLNRGSPRPDQHFLIFQWKTRRNNYVQILMKRTPFTKEDIVNLRRWLQDVDDIREMEMRLGRRIGPIRTAKATILHTPDESFSTNYSRILKGETDKDFLRTRNLQVTTDDRPFLFDVDPSRPELKGSYRKTLLMVLLLLPLFVSFLARYRLELRSALPYIFVVTLTGTGYLLVEVVLLQRYEIFLGSPVATFASVLGTLLVFSGLGSLWSGRISSRGLCLTLAAVLILLGLHLWFIPHFFLRVASFPLSMKVVLAVTSLAPLAFLLGVPFPWVMRKGKGRFSPSAAAVLFALNAASSALAVPLALNISTSWGLPATFQIGILLYLGVGIVLVAMQKPSCQILANGFAGLMVGLLLICPWLVSRSAVSAADSLDRYRVYGVSYGHSYYRQDKVIQGGSPAKSVPFAWLFWIVQGNGRTILVDTGCENPQTAQRWGIANYVQPVERLRQLGIPPSEVSDVILTHAHWDHMGGLTPYKKARVWMQEKEYHHAQSIMSAEEPEATEMRWQDLSILLSVENEGRLHLVRGEKELVPGITMSLGGDHTPGSQYVTVETLDGPVIIAGDACYLYRNIQRHIPIGSAVDQQANLVTIREMQRRAASPFLILPGHDPLVMKWFPQVFDGIVQVTTIPE